MACHTKQTKMSSFCTTYHRYVYVLNINFLSDKEALLQYLVIEGNDIVFCHLTRVARCTYIGDGLLGKCRDIGFGNTKI